MILQVGISNFAGNIVRLIGTCSEYKNISDMGDLRAKFIEFLNINQPRELPRNKKNFEMVNNLKIADYFKDYFNNDSVLDDKNQSQIILAESDTQAEKKKEIVNGGIDFLKSIESGHYHILEIIATEIFILPSREARAGSTSESIGVIWMNPKITYGANDMAEIMVHELTHQTMFIDELCESHYHYDEMLEKKNWPISAILKTNRPFDKVLHSAVVAMEILLFREKFIGHPLAPAIHPPTQVLKNQLNATIRSMEDISKKTKGILTERSANIIDILKENVCLIRSGK